VKDLAENNKMTILNRKKIFFFKKRKSIKSEKNHRVVKFLILLKILRNVTITSGDIQIRRFFLKKVNINPIFR
jgi:hypothetical protein